VTRAVAKNTGYPGGGSVSINTGRHVVCCWSVFADTGMVVVEDKEARIIRVPGAADTQVTRTQIAVFNVGRLWRASIHHLSAPRTILTVRRNDHPLLTQRVPPLLPFSRDVQGIPSRRRDAV
jgi:hypothetical protein